MPANATLSAPIPNHTEYAVPTGSVRSAAASMRKLATALVIPMLTSVAKGVGAGIGLRLCWPFRRVAYATRMDTGFAVRIIVFSTATPIAASPS